VYRCLSGALSGLCSSPRAGYAPRRRRNKPHEHGACLTCMVHRGEDGGTTYHTRTWGGLPAQLQVDSRRGGIEIGTVGLLPNGGVPTFRNSADHWQCHVVGSITHCWYHLRAPSGQPSIRCVANKTWGSNHCRVSLSAASRVSLPHLTTEGRRPLSRSTPMGQRNHDGWRSVVQ